MGKNNTTPEKPAEPEQPDIPTPELTVSNSRWGGWDSLNFLAILVGVLFVIIFPPLAVKIPMFILVCIGFIALVSRSHWTSGWSPRWKVGTSIVCLLVLCGLAIPQFVAQWKGEHAPSTAASLKLTNIDQKLGEISGKLDKPKREVSKEVGETAGATDSAAVRKLPQNQSSNKPEKQPNVRPAAIEYPPTLSDLFGKKDFSNTLRVTDEGFDYTWPDGMAIRIKPQVYLDFPAKTEFIGFYVPASKMGPSEAKSFEACMKLVEAVRPIITDLPKHHDVTGGFIGERTSPKELTFSGRVFLYHEDFLSIPQKAAIMELYSRNGFDVQFRGPDYFATQLIEWHREHDRATKQP